MKNLTRTEIITIVGVLILGCIAAYLACTAISDLMSDVIETIKNDAKKREQCKECEESKAIPIDKGSENHVFAGEGVQEGSASG